MSLKLREAAKVINDLAKREEDARRQLCIAIAGAMDLVKKDSNLTWSEWADQNLRKADGTKWSLHTLYKYAMYGRDPKKLTQARETIADLGRRARRSLNPTLLVSTSSAATVKVERVSSQQIDIDKEFNWLMSAWKNASPAARKRFLEAIAGERARSA